MPPNKPVILKKEVAVSDKYAGMTKSQFLSAKKDELKKLNKNISEKDASDKADRAWKTLSEQAKKAQKYANSSEAKVIASGIW